MLIPLSARKKDRLLAYAENLSTFLKNKEQKEQLHHFQLSSVAYTLQTGREAMEERVVFLVDDMEDFITALENFIAGNPDSHTWRGSKPKKTNAENLSNHKEGDIVPQWIANGELSKVAQSWVEGMDIDWETLYKFKKPNRVHLPPYPFAQRYYEKNEESKKFEDQEKNYVPLHPLLQKSKSNNKGVEFSSIFSGNEDFLKDHLVQGKNIMPGMAYLEMAQVAIKQLSQQEDITVSLHDMVWLQPFIAGEGSRKMVVTISELRDGEATYEMRSDSEDEIIFHHGRAVIHKTEENDSFDITAFKKVCSKKILTRSETYKAFEEVGLNYGPSHQGIETIYIGDNQVLASLELPLEKQETLDNYILHPGMMDSALQAALGIMNSSKNEHLTPRIPYALEEMIIYRPCSKRMWAIIQHSEGSRPEDGMIKLDINLCNEDGLLCGKLKGFYLREFNYKQENQIEDTILLAPFWYEDSLNLDIEKVQIPYEKSLVLFCGFEQYPSELDNKQLGNIDYRWLQSENVETAERYIDFADQILKEWQSMTNDNYKQKQLIQLVIPYVEDQQSLCGLSAILKTGHLENSLVTAQMIEVEELTTDIISILEEDKKREDQHIRYKQGKRWVMKWEADTSQIKNNTVPFKDNCTYLITGGAGSLGLLFAKEIANQVNQATVVLIGRSPLDHSKQESLVHIPSNINVVYECVDVTNENTIKTLVSKIKQKYGDINGVIHCAGVVQDSLIRSKTKVELDEVMAAKVKGLINLDESTQNCPLDFFICFSSASAVWGSVGQADYAAANAFMDHFMNWRSRLVEKKQRSGQTLSINWPYWKNGGMTINPSKEKMINAQFGMMSLLNDIGIQAFYQALTLAQSQVLIMTGDINQIRQHILASQNKSKKEQEQEEVTFKSNQSFVNLEEITKTDLYEVVSQLIHVHMDELDEYTGLDEYGFDSITFSELANELNQRYKLDLMPTIFFEHNTLHDLANYLSQTYYTILENHFKPGNDEIQSYQPVAEQSLDKSLRYSKGKVDENESIKPINSQRQEDNNIAIVGMSGLFPGGKDLDEFWENLVAGKDCITEIPEERWDWRKYASDHIDEANKTNVKWGAFIDGVDYFDPLFFGISPRQAELMDPQQRLLMMYAWKAIEDAGYAPQSLSDTKTGIFIGMGYSGYGNVINQAGSALEGYSATGMASAMGPNRMSYFLNVHGPSEPIDTACSSSLVAIDRAVNAIKEGYCDSAIVGGANLILTPDLHISFSKANMLSEDGRCKTFSDKANGYVRGEGVGMIYLKKLEDAEQAGDHIYGVVKGTSVNHGGRANSITAPNPKAQSKVLIDAYQKAGIDPQTVTYIEAHGTGTELGDPIEINGLKSAFSQLYEKTGKDIQVEAHCGLGSVKSNIGHLELAAGIAGVIKLLLQLKHKKLVKSLHADVINPYIQLEDSPFYIVQNNQEWKAIKDGEHNYFPRRAGISSFGFGGVNSHVVIEEYISEEPVSTTNNALHGSTAIILLSAKDGSRLKEQAKNLLQEVSKQDYKDEDLANLAYTLQVGRDAMEERLGLLVTSMQELREKLKDYMDGKKEISGLYKGQIVKQKGPMTALQADGDFYETLSQWWQKEKYHKLVNMWVYGMAIDWENLYTIKRPKRISLPTYPFARERYWIKRPKQNHATFKTPSLKEKILHKTWRPDTIQEINQRLKGTFIVLTTYQTFNMIEPMLADQDVDIIPVVHGEKGDQGVSTDFYCNEAGENLYKELKETIISEDFQGIIDLTAYDAGYEQELRIEWGKINFLQQIISNHRQTGCKVIQVTHRLQSLQVNQPTLQGARLTGLYRMLGAEYKQTTFITMDSDCTNDYDCLWMQVKETFQHQKTYTEYCYRQNQRFIPEMVEVPKPKIKVMETFKEDDVILITGGTRGIGAQIGNWAVRKGAKNLVIMGREDLPERSKWQEILVKQTDSHNINKIGHLKSLEDQGVQIYYDNTALSDYENLKLMVKKVHQKMGTITGVFHCAGAKGENPSFLKKSVQEMKEVCEPKIIGLTNLHRAIAEEPLEFFMLFSSVSSAIPYLAVGQSDYAMANAYMDFYASYQAGKGKEYFKSIQWPAWKETGMTTGGMKTKSYEMSGLQSLDTTDGLAFMEMIGRSNESVCMPSIIDPELFTINNLLRLKEPNLQKQTSTKETVRQGEEKDDMEDSSRAVNWLKQIFQKELKLIKAPDERVSFSEYGVDSIIIAQIAQVIQREIGQTISPSLFLEHDNIAALADYLVEHYGASFQTETKSKEEKKVDVSSDSSVSDRYMQQQEEDLAIIGISSRFPNAPTKEAYWQLLKQGKSAIRPVPQTRWKTKDREQDNGGWISDIDQFDPDFFHINQADAAIMDPQARLLLEESLKTIYDAGYNHNELRGESIGVYIGGRSQPVAPMDQILQSSNPILGMGQNYLASNISKFFDFKGPSLVVDTACSSGLSGLLMASDALQTKRIDMALVGASSLLLNSTAHEVFAARNILSQNAKFEIMDKQSSGEVLGEGIGIVMVKRLSDAIQDGNNVYGIVKGIAVNNDGRTLGPGSPSLDAQEQVIKEALRISGKNPQDIGYIELNGGGTPIMDTIEIKALSAAYDLKNHELNPVYLGATKPNIGHLLLASGMASFIRCLLSVYYGEVPPFLSAKTPFEHYDFAQSRILFNRESVKWPTSKNQTRVAALSSFPDGGTNYHVVIESHISKKDSFLNPKKSPNLNNRKVTGIVKNETKKKLGDEQIVRNVWGEIK